MTAVRHGQGFYVISVPMSSTTIQTVHTSAMNHTLLWLQEWIACVSLGDDQKRFICQIREELDTCYCSHDVPPSFDPDCLRGTALGRVTLPILRTRKLGVSPENWRIKCWATLARGRSSGTLECLKLLADLCQITASNCQATRVRTVIPTSFYSSYQRRLPIFHENRALQAMKLPG